MPDVLASVPLSEAERELRAHLRADPALLATFEALVRDRERLQQAKHAWRCKAEDGEARVAAAADLERKLYAAAKEKDRTDREWRDRVLRLADQREVNGAARLRAAELAATKARGLVKAATHLAFVWRRAVAAFAKPRLTRHARRWHCGAVQAAVEQLGRARP